MSKLLNDLIKQNREDAAAYEKFLGKAEALVKRLAAKLLEDGVPAVLHGRREATAIYNNLPQICATGRCQEGGATKPSIEDGDERLKLALEIDRVMRERAPAGWKGDQTREARSIERTVSTAGPQPRSHTRIV